MSNFRDISRNTAIKFARAANKKLPIPGYEIIVSEELVQKYGFYGPGSISSHKKTVYLANSAGSFYLRTHVSVNGHS